MAHVAVPFKNQVPRYRPQTVGLLLQEHHRRGEPQFVETATL